nr:InlB B-repeat-containing protein [Butyrivibrio sp. AC2005]
MAPVEENTETPAEEAAPEEENTETPAEEVAPAEESAETPAEEVAPAEENAEAPAEDAAPAEETPAEETSAEKTSEEISAETPEQAEKEVKEVTVTYTASKGGTVSKASETIDINAEDAKFEGATATPWSEKYEFVNWTDADGNEVSTEDTFVPSDIEEDVTFTANFAIPDDMPELSVEDIHEGGMVVSVKAEAGIFPDGTEVRVTAISDDQALATAQGELGESITTAKGVDITFFFEGEEIQPADEKFVHVTLALEEAMDVEDVTVLHDHNDDVETIDKTDISKNAEGEIESVEFNSNEFSIYIVAGEEVKNNRLHVVFKNGDFEASMWVKQSDTTTPEIYETVLYDPGVGELEEDVIFKGWTTDPNYNDPEAGFTIDKVRDEVKAKLATPINDGDEVTYYAMLYKQFSVKYLDNADNNYVALGQHSALYRADATDDKKNTEYTVNMAYTPLDDEHDFQGWYVYKGSENIVKKGDIPYTYTENDVFNNGDSITIQGDVVFSVNSPAGHWLVFDENGKGATYCAPRFYLSNETTVEPRPRDEMTRKGYTFDGWWTGEPAETGADPTGEEFVFGKTLAARTTVYAKWLPNDKAPYTIMIWKQNAARNGYDFADSCVGYGTVGANIKNLAITEAKAGTDMYYIKTEVEKDDGTVDKRQYGGITSAEAKVMGPDDPNRPYIGFTENKTKLKSDVTITPEGDAVLNVYFDRMHYNYKMVLVRQNAGKYYGAGKEGNGAYSGDWSLGLTDIAFLDGVEKSESGGYIYYTFDAYYGDNISSKWLKLPDENNCGGAYFISWILMKNAKAYTYDPATDGSEKKGKNTVKGDINILDEMIIGDLTSSDANYVTARFDGVPYVWTYNIYYANSDGEYGATPDKTIIARSRKSSEGAAHPPEFEGYLFDHQDGHKANETTRECSINFYYKPLSYPIRFMDGQYYDGNLGKIGTPKSSNMLHVVKDITYDANIVGYLDKDKEKTGFDKDKPECPEKGFVFDGWYLDEGCSGEKFNFNSKMPLGGVTVYAKWIQIQYRVFLHPNAKLDNGANDESLYWGSSGQEMNFRVDYNGTISAPVGTRDEYVFVGWYLDEACSHNKVFNATGYKLNESTVTEAYDKNTHNTDVMNKFGEGATWNSDLAVTEGDNQHPERTWITQEFNLYGKWRKILDGADGINIEYVLTDPAVGTGTGKAIDSGTYVDNAKANAVPAVTAPGGYEFSTWVLQKWDGGKYVDTNEEVEPGKLFTVLASNAKVENIDESGVHKKYTVRLRAKYVKPDKKTPTYIPWFENDGTEAYHIDKVKGGKNELDINEAVGIQGIPSEAEDKEDYEFVGWARISMGESEAEAQAFMSDPSKFTQNVDPNNPGFLYYKNGKFYEDAGFSKVATQVAADEAMPYQALFAVWREKDLLKVYITGNNDTVYYNGNEQSVTGYKIDKITYKDQEITDIESIEPYIKLVTSGSDTAKGTNVKRNAETNEIEVYEMGLHGTPSKGDTFKCSFECTHQKYPDVKFYVTDGYLKINPLELKVEVIGNRGEELYDGTEKRVTGYTLNAISAVSVGAGIPDAKDFFDEKKVEFTGEDVAKGIQPGTYPMNLAVSQFSYDDPNIDVTFEVIDGQLIIRDVPEAGKLHVIARTPDREEMYSGKTWVGSDFDYSVEGKVANEGIITSALKSLGSFIGINAHAEDGTKEITINNEKYYVSGLRVDVNARSVGKYPLDIVNEGFKVVDVNGQDVTDKFDDPEFIIGTLTITPKPIELTSGSAEKVYDATPLVYHVANANTEWGIGDAVTYNFTGSQTEVGTSKNTFAAVPANDLTDFKNYIITYVYGDLTVTKSSDSNPPDDDKKKKKKTTESDKKRDDEGDSTNDNSSNDNGGNNDNVLGARRNPPATGDNAAVLGAKRTRGEEPGVLGARRGGTEDSTNTSRIIVLLIAAGAVVTLLITGRKRKKDEE